MIYLDRRTERRLRNNLNRMAEIDCLVDDLTSYSVTGRHLKSLTDEFFRIKEDCKLYDIPLGTRISSDDGSMTLGRMPGQRVLDVERYFNSGISGIMLREHPDVLVPVSADAFTEAMGCNVNGYYSAKPFTAVTDNVSFRSMMDHITLARV